ncbi:MAG: acylphosphatase [Spirochaetaceae bacterium]|nr:acylphosphatase [Spirochaetaceae bacterium]
MRSALAQVRGRVQGVGFRYSALRTARSLGLRGWVRNEVDGSVTTRFEGPEADVEQYISWLKKGPSSSFVKDVMVTELNADGSLADFQITY